MRSPYLFAYNAALWGAWAYVLYLTFQDGYRPDTKSLKAVWKRVEMPLKVRRAEQKQRTTRGGGGGGGGVESSRLSHSLYTLSATLLSSSPFL
jgi:hypothetical protein